MTVQEELGAWLDEHWDPELTARRVVGGASATAGLVHARPGPPSGRAAGLGRADAVAVRRRAASHAASPAGPRGWASTWAAPRSSPSAPTTSGARYLADIAVRPHRVVSAVQRARRRLRPRRRCARGRCATVTSWRGDRPEGVVDPRATTPTTGYAARPHRPDRAQAPRHHVVRDRRWTSRAWRCGRCAR